jgi:hypothetical protein
MIAKLDTAQYRYERKFHITQLSRPHVESIVRLNPAVFSEIYHPRWVNSIYLDSWSMVSYHENLIGYSHDRTKYRIRWYGDMFGQVERPVLELKIRQGEVNRKQSYELGSLVVDENLSLSTIHELFRSASLPESVRGDLLKLRPVIANRYSRNYFLSADRQFRSTIDSDVTYFDASEECRRLRFHWLDPASVIVELKYPVEAAAHAHHIGQHFPFRLTRNSKYVTGVEQVRCR